MFQLSYKLGKRLQRTTAIAFEPMKYFNRQKRMLIDRVAVIKIAEYEKINRFEFGQRPSEKVKRVHRPQCICCMGKDKNFAQVLPQILVLRRGFRQPEV